MDKRVLDVMLPFFCEKFGNAASRQHYYGWEAEEALDLARDLVASLIGASPGEIIFTSGSTESNNLAIKGAAWARLDRGNHLVTSSIEHDSVLGPLHYLCQHGFEVTSVNPRPDGTLDTYEIENAIKNNTILVTIMMANHEIGTINNVRKIAEICANAGVLFHTDAAQAAGKIPIDVVPLECDLLSFSAHKIYGPKGIGALYIRRKRPRVQLEALLHGGGQERGLRSGTVCVPNVVGFGEAARLSAKELESEHERLRKLRDRLLTYLEGQTVGSTVNGSMQYRLPGNLNVSFLGVEEDELIKCLNECGIAVSSGAACTSGETGRSRVLRALRSDEPELTATLRFGLGRFTTLDEIDYTAERVVSLIDRLSGKRLK